MREKPAKKHGGKRAGAGRPAIYEDRVIVPVSVPAKLRRAWQERAKTEGISLSELIRRTMGG